MGKRRHAYRSHRELIDFYERQARAINLTGGMWKCPHCEKTPRRVREHLKDEHGLGTVPPSFGWKNVTEEAAALQGATTLTLESRFSPRENPRASTVEIRAGKWTHREARPSDVLAVWIAEHAERLIEMGFPVRVLLWPAAPASRWMDGVIMIAPDLVQILRSLNVDDPFYTPWLENLDAWLAETEREQAGRAA